jgi:drug/metabolite transporter (DMT)-like permease
MPARLSMSATDWFLLVVLSILWGGSFLFAKIAVDELPPLTLALGRVAIAAAILAALAHAGGASLAALVRGWRAFAVLGVLNCAIPFSLIFWGQTHIPTGLASILNATTPIFTVLIAQVATRDEKLTAGKLVGVGAGFLGVAAMLGPDLLIDIGAGVWAQLACLVAAISYALAGVYGRRLADLPAVVVAAGQLIAATIVLAPLAALIDRPWTLPTPSQAALAALLALAVLSTALAYVIYFRILARAGATNLLLVTFLIPVSAIVLGTIVLGERLAPHQFAGMAVIALGLAAIDGRPLHLVARMMGMKRRDAQIEKRDGTDQRVGTGFSPR